MNAQSKDEEQFIQYKPTNQESFRLSPVLTIFREFMKNVEAEEKKAKA